MGSSQGIDLAISRQSLCNSFGSFPPNDLQAVSMKVALDVN